MQDQRIGRRPRAEPMLESGESNSADQTPNPEIMEKTQQTRGIPNAV